MSIEIENLSRIAYPDARFVQEKAIEDYLKGIRSERILFCEHLPVITLGTRAEASDIVNASYFEKNNIPILNTDRGGQATYHGLGQLIFYPVVDVRKRHLGVKKFVSLGLEAISETINKSGLKTEVSLQRPGVWLLGKDKKIASVGLKISNGVSNHGFSLNVFSDLEVYNYFHPCGMKGSRICSLSQEIDASNFDLFELGYEVSLALKNKLE